MTRAELNFLSAWVRDAADPHNPSDCRALRAMEDLVALVGLARGSLIAARDGFDAASMPLAVDSLAKTIAHFPEKI